MLFDTHAHYDDDKFETDRNYTIEKAYESGVSYIINAATDISSTIESISLAQEYEYVYAAVGTHPHHVEEMNEKSLELFADFASDPKVVAIGEIGLDYYYDNSPRELQRYWFAQQIKLALKLGLPIVIHDRDAHEDTMKIVKEERAWEAGGVFHCFSGSLETARELFKMGFYISLGGAVTFKNARRAVEVVESMPLDRLLLETDCPYMTPEPFRGKRNDSSRLFLVAEKIAAIRGVPVEEIAEITTQNAKRLFKIS